MRWLFLLCLPLAAQHTYYISSGIGSDSNTSTQAQSKTTPWAHAPGMANCASACASYSPIAGDQFIFRGGDTWVAACFEWIWTWSGSGGLGGTPIYIGVDKTWFTGGSWVRPIMDGGSAAVSGSDDNLLRISGKDSVIVDDFEWNHGAFNGNTYGSSGYIAITNSTNIDIKNHYLHGWQTILPYAGSFPSAYYMITGFSTATTNVGSIAEYNVIDGSDTPLVVADPTCSGACLQDGGGIIGFPTVQYNIVLYTITALIGGGQTSVHDNLLMYVRRAGDSTCGGCTGGESHTNIYESNGDDCSTGLFFYNNVAAHVQYNLGTVGVWPDPCTSGATTYAWNNVVFDIANSNVWPSGDNNGGHTGFQQRFNNTIEAGPDPGSPLSVNSGQSASGSCGTLVAGTATSTNDFCITSSSPLTQFTQTNILGKTVSQAALGGYAITNPYPFAPSSVAGATVGAASNQTASCSGNLASLCQDTTFACVYNVSNHTPACPARTPFSRPSSGAWDIGAYQFAGLPASISSGSLMHGPGVH